MKAYHWQRLIEEREAERMAKGLAAQQPRPPVVANHPKINARKGAPLCVECVAHSWSFDWMTGKVRHRCHDPMTHDPVTGDATDPTFNRRNALSCGPQGAYWRARPVAKAQPPACEPEPIGEPEQYVPPVPFRVLASRPSDDVVAVLWDRRAA